MRAAKYMGEGRVVLDPSHAGQEPGEEEVRIRVAYSGICGTDLHVLHGHMDQRVTMPAVLGHEMSGRVESLGAAAARRSPKLKPGSPVTVMPLRWCGDCPTCRAGHQHICPQLDFIGIDTPGAMQELWNVPVHTVIPLPEDLDLAHAALIEPLAVAVHDVRRSRLGAGETAVVIGGGPIGQLISLVAQQAGASVVLAEPDAGRRRFAEEGGGRLVTVDPSAEDLAETVSAVTGGTGADVVFEVAGLPATALDAMRHARPRGRVVIVAIHPQPVPMDLHRMFWRELEVLGARVYEREDFEEAARLLAGGGIPAARLISDVVPLSEVPRAFARLSDSQAMKILVDVQGGKEHDAQL